MDKKKVKTKYFVYILECSDKSYYIGYTTNLENRIDVHNNSKYGAKYTNSRRPVILKYYECLQNLSEALKRERHLKKLSHTEKQHLFDTL